MSNTYLNRSGKHNNANSLSSEEMIQADLCLSFGSQLSLRLSFMSVISEATRHTLTETDETIFTQSWRAQSANKHHHRSLPALITAQVSIACGASINSEPTVRAQSLIGECGASFCLSVTFVLLLLLHKSSKWLLWPPLSGKPSRNWLKVKSGQLWRERQEALWKCDRFSHGTQVINIQIYLLLLPFLLLINQCMHLNSKLRIGNLNSLLAWLWAKPMFRSLFGLESEQKHVKISTWPDFNRIQQEQNLASYWREINNAKRATTKRGINWDTSCQSSLYWE